MENQDAVLSVLNTQINYMTDKPQFTTELPESGPEALTLSLLFFIFFFLSKQNSIKLDVSCLGMPWKIRSTHFPIVLECHLQSSTLWKSVDI